MSDADDDAVPTLMTAGLKGLASITDPKTVPLLHPAPGRCIIRIVPRLLEPQTASGVALSLDGRYENQPMIGSLQEIGDPTSQREERIMEWAKMEAEQGHLFVFSQYGAGAPFWNDEMRKMLPAGYDFRWLQGMRLFDIGQLAVTVSGTGAYGERISSLSMLELQ